MFEAKEDLLSAFRDILHGATQPAMVSAQRDALLEWTEDSLARFRELSAGIRDQAVSERLQRGFWWFSYCLVGDLARPTATELRDMLLTVPKYSGWPPFVFLSGDGRAPYARHGIIECWLAGNLRIEPTEIDFWRADPGGRFFVLRSHQDDSPRNGILPGTVFDAGLPIWRAGECLLHAASMADRLGAPDEAPILARAGWTGLSGRRLSRWANENWAGYLAPEGRGGAEEATSVTRATVQQVRVALPEVLAELLRPLYEVFDFAEMPVGTIAHEVGRLTRGAS